MFRSILHAGLLALALALGPSLAARAQEHHHVHRPLLHRIFPYGLRTPHPDNPIYNPYTDMRYWYPKYYGGIHYRDFHRQAYPTGDFPIRGTAW